MLCSSDHSKEHLIICSCCVLYSKSQNDIAVLDKVAGRFLPHHLPVIQIGMASVIRVLVKSPMTANGPS